MLKNRHTKKNGKSSWLILSNPLTASTLSDTSYRQNVTNFIFFEPETTFEQRLLKLLEKHRFRSQFNFFVENIDRYANISIWKENFSNDRAFILYKAVSIHSADHLNMLLPNKQKIEDNIIQGNFIEAENFLDACSSLAKGSLWYIRTKILLLSYQRKTDELEAYCSECKKKTPHELIKFIINCFQLITHSDNSSLHLHSLIDPLIKEFKEANLGYIVALLELFFLPSPIVSKPNYASALPVLQILCFIDAYLLLNAMLSHSVAAAIRGDTLNCSPSNITSYIQSLRSKINDPSLDRMLEALDEKSILSPSSLGLELLKNYEIGNYLIVIRTFNDKYHLLPYPLAYSNLVAKALAYIGIQEKLHGDHIIAVLTNKLAEIYGLSPLARQSEQDIISLIVKLNGTGITDNVQLSVYKALSNKYSANDACTAAILARIASCETTPLGEKMLKHNFNLLQHQSDEKDLLDTPNYRKLKRKIIRQIAENLPTEHIFAELDKLEESGALKKDFLEIFVNYCFYTKDSDRLVKKAATYLVENPSSHVCFRLPELISKIEDDRLCSLEAVIVAYSYYRNVSDEKDYVLHEALEDFLLTQDAEKPSQLLARMESGTLSPLWSLFFREICTPEIIDFLSCFTSTDELRVERVKILDSLLDLGGIEATTRMKEVEDLVGQVIVDSGISELNGPKIYVDNSAIKRKISDELKALLLIYKNTTSSTDNRITILEEELNIDGVKSAYASGSKNAVLLKIWNVVRDAFLFDEKNGLDKNLSGEIRHGFFSNLMRARFEERYLITELDENGHYKSNNFWRDNNSFLIEDIWLDINSALAVFSRGLNNLISEAEGWMKIRGHGKDSANGITIGLDVDNMLSLGHYIDQSQNADQVADHILQILWDITEKEIFAVRERLNVEFRSRLDDIFEQLENSIGIAKKGAPLLELTATIKKTRGEIKEDVSTAAEWFQRSKAADLGSRSLDFAIRIAVSSFERVKALTNSVEFQLSARIREIVVETKAVKPLIIAIINLLDNCYRHSGLARSTRVLVIAERHEGHTKIAVMNDMSEQKSLLLSEEKIMMMNEKIHQRESLALLRVEGGSGIAKAYRHIIDSSPGSQLTFHFHNNHFSANIVYVN